MDKWLEQDDEQTMKRLQEENQRFKKALAFYADPEHYQEWANAEELTEFIHDVDFDGGDLARKALEPVE